VSMPPPIGQEYLGYRIRVHAYRGDNLFATVYIEHAEGAKIRFSEHLDWFVKAMSRGWPDDDEAAANQLMEQAFHRVRGAILLDGLHELNEAHVWVPQEPRYAERSDDYIRRVVLSALRRVLELTPQKHGHVPFDDIGVCLLEDIEPTRLDYILERLDKSALIEYWAYGADPGDRTLRATAQGLAEADKLGEETKAPGLLVEETVATVEAVLNKHKPELVEQLRRQSLRIAESRELSEHEVGEIAQACEQIIWDFLDLDVLWAGVAEERPERQKTRDRLRLILKARAPSDTETSLLEALEQYLVGWFGPLEVFVHKHRHLPGESERRHAKRLVTYTYLLLADLSELLGL